MRRLGVHTSIAGGIELSLKRAKELGCSTVQIFTHNPRQWIIKEIPSDSIFRFKKFREDFDINPVFVHTSYLINLSSQNIEIVKKSIELLIKELDIADMIDADYAILHTGSASQVPEEIGRQRAIEALRQISIQKQWRTKLLLENTAGERGDISSEIKDLAEIIDKTNNPLIGGVCIDTCHAFAAGYDIRDKKGQFSLIEEIELYIGLNNLKLIHLNDSKRGYNTRVDRHEHIGIGRIGLKGLKGFINHPLLKDIPLILETPKKSDEDDKRNLAIVKKML